MKSRSLFGTAVLSLASAALCAAVLSVVACAGSDELATEGPGVADPDSGGTTLPPSGADASTSTSDSGGRDAAKDAIADAKKDGPGNTGTAPACTFGGDTVKLLTKVGEIASGLPCDSACNATTHCCLELLPGLPFDAGALPGTSLCITK